MMDDTEWPIPIHYRTDTQAESRLQWMKPNHSTGELEGLLEALSRPIPLLFYSDSSQLAAGRAFKVGHSEHRRLQLREGAL